MNDGGSPLLAFKKYTALFEALGNSNRQMIMITLAKNIAIGSPLTVQQLADQTELSRPTISHHIKVLKSADLLIVNKVGTKLYYQPKFETPLKMAHCLVDKLEDMKIITLNNKKG